MRGLDGVRMLVLAITGAEFQRAQQVQHLGVQAMDAGLVRSALAFFANDLLNFGAGVFHQLFDTGRVDPPVHDQLGHRPLGDFAPYRIKTADGDRLRRIIDDHVNAGCQFEGANIAPVCAR